MSTKMENSQHLKLKVNALLERIVVVPNYKTLEEFGG